MPQLHYPEDEGAGTYRLDWRARLGLNAEDAWPVTILAHAYAR